jgi:DNA-binding SARP family transcriptional activator
MKHPAKSAHNPALQVHTFGLPEVLLGNQEVQWRSDSARQLFLYLLTYPAGQSREHIIETLWHTPADANANNRFRVTIHRIRVALGWPGAVLEEYGRYRLAPEILQASDIAAFEQLLEQAAHGANTKTRLEQYQHALSLYRGEFLLGEEGEWVGEARNQLRTGFVRAKLETARLLCAQGNCTASIEAQKQALQTDPYLGEQHHQRLMGCLWATQDKYAAIEYYRRFVHFLQQEVGDTPMPETTLLAEHIKQDELPCHSCWEAWASQGMGPSCPLVAKVQQQHQLNVA